MTKYPNTQTDNTAKDEVNEALDTPEDGQPGVHTVHPLMKNPS